jgi:LytR cell envelope-related transcriptional attenuator
MPVDLTLPAAAVIGRDLLVPLGGIAAILAMLGMILVLPILVGQRREIARLTGWMDREPDAGTTEFQAIGTEATIARGIGPSGPPGYSSAAERVTTDRPALERIGTSEQRAIALEQAPWWRRVIERGPRHPLVISLLAIAMAVGVFIAVGHFLRAGEEGGRGAPIDPASVTVVVLNASTSSGLAGSVSDDLTAATFDVASTSVASDDAKESIVMYADTDSRRKARAVARELGISEVKPFDKEALAAANGADVVVFAADDLAKSSGGGG